MNDNDEKVGYGRPPKHTQFQKGRSGNPKGRPKGSQNWQTLLAMELAEPVTISMDGKTERLTKKRYLVKSRVHRAAKGDDKAFKWIETNSPSESPEESKPADDSERQSLRERMQKALNGVVETEKWKREKRFAARKFLLKWGIPEEIINDGFGIIGMEPEEAEQRQARAIEYMRAQGIPEEQIQIVEDRNEDGSSRFLRKLEPLKLTGG